MFHRELADGVGRGVSKTVGGVTIWQQVEAEGKLVNFWRSYDFGGRGKISEIDAIVLIE